MTKIFHSYNEVKDHYFPKWRDKQYLKSLSQEEYAKEIGRRLAKYTIEKLKNKEEV